MESLNDPLLNFWRSYGDWGFNLVILGVAGEVLAVIADFVSEKCCKKWHKKWKRRLRLIEIISGAVLILGLAMEYRGHKYETQILDSYNAKSYLEAKQAELQIAELNSNNLVLAKQLNETKMQQASAEARLIELQTNLSKIDPLKAPVQDVLAYVQFRLPANPENLELRKAQAVINCSTFLDFNDGPTEFWSGSAFITGPGVRVRIVNFSPVYLAENRSSAQEVINGIEKIRLRIFNLPVTNSEVANGFASVRINGKLYRQFSIGPAVIKAGSAELTGITNGPVEIR